jgi:GNAT superfamily N-acetyltransferase
MVEIRQIAPTDAEEVSLLITQLGYQRTLEQVLQWIAAIDTRQQVAFVATLEGVVVGWIEIAVVYHLQSAPYALIGGLVVKDGIRGKGVGRSLCERAETWAWSVGVDTVRVTSRSSRIQAHRFYLRDGYRIDKTSLVFEKKAGPKKRVEKLPEA